MESQKKPSPTTIFDMAWHGKITKIAAKIWWMGEMMCVSSANRPETNIFRNE